ncbi:MAG TPA: carboxypeptidase-like regulatory domain-containing protein [Chitinivibrionales bacterium]|nr:carboxypeptidase-like regulatory domain-containing protein [Chitinivibrionales bacterium]
MMKKMSIILSILALSVFTANAGTVSGVVDSAGAAVLANVIVTVTPAGGGTALADTTTATGDYSIAGVPAGAQTITATKDGFTAYTGVVFVTAAGVTTRNISLAAEPPGITVTGHVFDSASGNPLAGVIIRLTTIGGGATLVDSTLTIANGSYSLTHVQTGRYDLSAAAVGHVTQTVVIAAAAANLTQDFTLPPLPAGIVISGHVMDSVSGNPISGAVVRLRTGGAAGGTIIDSAITATNGSYSIDSVQAGTYALIAAAAGHVTKTVTGVVVANAAVTRDFALAGLPAGVSITGTVVDSVSGDPIAGAIVRLRTPGGIGGGGGALVDSAITAANGTYSIDSVQAGTYNLVASATGHANKTDAGIVVAAVALVRDFELVKTPGIAITGRVADSTSGLPLGGAIVRAFQAGVLVDSAIVAANGTYSLDVPAGVTTLTANAAGHGTKTITGLNVTVAVTENFFLVAGGTGVVLVADNRSTKPEFVMTAGHILQLRNFNDAGVVSVYGLSGKLVYRTTIEAHAASVVLPSSLARTGGLYLVSISQRNAVYRKQIVLQ